MLLVFGAPCQLPSLAGQEHGRTITLPDIRNLAIKQKAPDDAGALSLMRSRSL
jgi:hypothetical protein